MVTHRYPPGICKHCGKDGYRLGRDLCRRCYLNPEIKAKYPRMRKGVQLREIGESDKRTSELAKRAARGLPLFGADSSA